MSLTRAAGILAATRRHRHCFRCTRPTLSTRPIALRLPVPSSWAPMATGFIAFRYLTSRFKAFATLLTVASSTALSIVVLSGGESLQLRRARAHQDPGKQGSQKVVAAENAPVEIWVPRRDLLRCGDPPHFGFCAFVDLAAQRGRIVPLLLQGAWPLLLLRAGTRSSLVRAHGRGSASSGPPVVKILERQACARLPRPGKTALPPPPT